MTALKSNFDFDSRDYLNKPLEKFQIELLKNHQLATASSTLNIELVWTHL